VAPAGCQGQKRCAHTLAAGAVAIRISQPASGREDYEGISDFSTDSVPKNA
jgi:hypothetical protein